MLSKRPHLEAFIVAGDDTLADAAERCRKVEERVAARLRTYARDRKRLEKEETETRARAEAQSRERWESELVAIRDGLSRRP